MVLAAVSVIEGMSQHGGDEGQQQECPLTTVDGAVQKGVHDNWVLEGSRCVAQWLGGLCAEVRTIYSQMGGQQVGGPGQL